jgi:hypothetical protein
LVSRFYAEAHKKGVTKPNILFGFRAAGISPFQRKHVDLQQELLVTARSEQGRSIPAPPPDFVRQLAVLDLSNQLSLSKDNMPGGGAEGDTEGGDADKEDDGNDLLDPEDLDTCNACAISQRVRHALRTDIKHNTPDLQALVGLLWSQIQQSAAREVLTANRASVIEEFANCWKDRWRRQVGGAQFLTHSDVVKALKARQLADEAKAAGRGHGHGRGRGHGCGRSCGRGPVSGRGRGRGRGGGGTRATSDSPRPISDTELRELTDSDTVMQGSSSSSLSENEPLLYAYNTRSRK